MKLRPVLADNRDGSDIAMGETTKVVRQAKHRLVLALALAGAAVHLQVHLIDHAQAGSADRMAETFQAAVDLAGDLPVRIVKSVEHILDGAALGRGMPILHGDE